MALFRKIVVDGHEYEWKYTFDDYDWQEPSHLVFRSVDRKLKIILYFRSPGWEIGKCPFNAGLPAVKDGGPVIVNMNQMCIRDRSSPAAPVRMRIRKVPVPGP